MSWHHPDFLRLGIGKAKYKDDIAEEPNEGKTLKKGGVKEEKSHE